MPVKIGKEKIIVFRSYKKMIFDPKTLSDKEAKKIFVEMLFKKGYVPINIGITKNYDNLGKTISCVAGYAGKKMA